MSKRLLVIIFMVICMSAIITGCSKPSIFGNNTRVRVMIEDTSGRLDTISKWLLCIHQQDISKRYSGVTSGNPMAVDFTNVAPGRYYSHGEKNATDSSAKHNTIGDYIEVNKGDNIIVKFTYYISGWNGNEATCKWRYEVVKD